VQLELPELLVMLLEQLVQLALLVMLVLLDRRALLAMLG